MKKFWQWCQAFNDWSKTLWNPIGVAAIGGCAAATFVIWTYEAGFSAFAQAAATLLGPALSLLIFYIQRHIDITKARREELHHIWTALEAAIKHLDDVPDTNNYLKFIQTNMGSSAHQDTITICKRIYPSVTSANREVRTVLGSSHISPVLITNIKKCAIILREAENSVNYVFEQSPYLLQFPGGEKDFASGVSEAMENLNKAYESVRDLCREIIDELNRML